MSVDLFPPFLSDDVATSVEGMISDRFDAIMEHTLKSWPVWDTHQQSKKFKGDLKIVYQHLDKKEDPDIRWVIPSSRPTFRTFVVTHLIWQKMVNSGANRELLAAWVWPEIFQRSGIDWHLLNDKSARSKNIAFTLIQLGEREKSSDLEVLVVEYVSQRECLKDILELLLEFDRPRKNIILPIFNISLIAEVARNDWISDIVIRDIGLEFIYKDSQNPCQDYLSIGTHRSGDVRGELPTAKKFLTRLIFHTLSTLITNKSNIFVGDEEYSHPCKGDAESRSLISDHYITISVDFVRGGGRGLHLPFTIADSLSAFHFVTCHTTGLQDVAFGELVNIYEVHIWIYLGISLIVLWVVVTNTVEKFGRNLPE